MDIGLLCNEIPKKQISHTEITEHTEKNPNRWVAPLEVTEPGERRAALRLPILLVDHLLLSVTSVTSVRSV